MKKILFFFPVLALLAVGCNSSQQAAVQNASQIYTVGDNLATQIYTNDTNGFSLSIPKEYSIDTQSANQISFDNSQQVPMVTISIMSSNGLPLSYFVGKDTGTEQQNNSKVGGETAIRLSGGTEQSGGLAIAAGGQWVQYQFIHKGSYYTIAKLPVADISNSQFDNMISSFKFTK